VSDLTEGGRQDKPYNTVNPLGRAACELDARYNLAMHNQTPSLVMARLNAYARIYDTRENSMYPLVSPARFGSRPDFLIYSHNDSAWFCIEELKKHSFASRSMVLHRGALPLKVSGQLAN
jgi:hypothetical protein